MIEQYFFFAVGYISLVLSMVLVFYEAESRPVYAAVMAVASVVLILGGATNILIATVCSLALLASATVYLATAKEEKSYRVTLFSIVVAISAMGTILGLYTIYSRYVQHTFSYPTEAPRMKVLIVCATSGLSIVQVWTQLIDQFGRELDVTVQVPPSHEFRDNTNGYRLITHPWLEEVCSQSYDIVCFNDCIPVKEFLDMAGQLMLPENRGRCPNIMDTKFVFLDKGQVPIANLSAYFYLSRGRKDVDDFLSLFEAQSSDDIPYHKLSYASIAKVAKANQSHLSDAREE
jgi:hypothetical protein